MLHHLLWVLKSILYVHSSNATSLCLLIPSSTICQSSSGMSASLRESDHFSPGSEEPAQQGVFTVPWGPCKNIKSHIPRESVFMSTNTPLSCLHFSLLDNAPSKSSPQVSPGSSCHGSANSYSSFGAESLSSLLGFIVGRQPEEDVESDLERASDALGERVFSLVWVGLEGALTLKR